MRLLLALLRHDIPPKIWGVDFFSHAFDFVIRAVARLKTAWQMVPE